MSEGINLLPWREARRWRQQRRALATAIMLWVLSLATVAASWWYFEGEIRFQRTRNTFLEGQIAKVERQLQEISEIRQRKDELIERMGVIHQLQAERIRLVRGLDHLPRELPEGVFFSSLERDNKGINLTGIAQSSSRVSTLMERLDQTRIFGHSELNIINVGDTHQFELWVMYPSLAPTDADADSDNAQ